MSEINTGDPVLDEIVRRIVAVADPDKVILFGSRARGDAREDSDYDVLVVGPSTEGYYRRTGALYLALCGLGISKDVVWLTPEEAEKCRAWPGHFTGDALREGRVLHGRAA